jgi:transposase
VERAGYQRLQQWVCGLGEQVEFGVQGCGSYGAGLVSHLVPAGSSGRGGNRPDRSMRHLRGTNDTIDARGRGPGGALRCGQGGAHDRQWHSWR